MRVLSVIHGPVFGGGHSQMIRLRRPLAARGCETIGVVPAEPGNARPRLEATGVDVVSTPLHRLRATADPVTHVRFLRRFWPEIGALRELIRDRHIDVVQAHGDTNPHVAIAAHLERTAVVWQLYDTRTPMPLRRVTMPLVVRLADAMTTWGEALARDHPGTERLGHRLLTVFPPVDTREFRPDRGRRAAARERLNVPERATVIGTVGNLNPSKGHEYLLRAAQLVRQRQPDTVVRILGAQSPAHAAYETSLRSEARDSGLGDPSVLDMADPGAGVADLMPAFDVFALTSVPRSEGIPTVILEAMACGIPVVATDVGAITELVEDGKTGFVVPPLDPEAVAAAILRLIGDEALRDSFGRAARRRAEDRYDIEALAEVHHRAYQVALEHRRARSTPG